jgi:hypothetical protein
MDPAKAKECLAMERIEKTMDVDCPMRTAYDGWRRLEAFNRFIEKQGIPDGAMHDSAADPKILR